MQAYRIRLAPCIAFFASACGASEAGPTLNHYGGEVTDSVAAVGVALSAHHEEVLVETGLERMRDIEHRHMDDMGMHMGRMLDAQDSMDLCGEHMGTAGHRAPVQPLRDARSAMGEAIDDASAEMERHQQAMDAVADVDTAFAEEHGHQAEMNRILERMRQHDGEISHAMQAMEDDGMSMMCPMDSHMHRQH